MHDRGSIRNVRCGMLRSWRSATPWINALDRFATCRPQHCNSIGSIRDVLICNVAEVAVDCRRRYRSLSKRHSPSKRHPPKKTMTKGWCAPEKGQCKQCRAAPRGRTDKTPMSKSHDDEGSMLRTQKKTFPLF